MNRDLLKILLFLGIVFIFGGWQGLYNLGILSWFYFGLIILILITFFKKDLIIIALKIVYNQFIAKRRR